MAIGTEMFETINPATGEVIAEVPEASPADVDAAVEPAREAFRPGGPWRSLLPAQRARVLWRIGDLIDEHADELAELETRDQGQPIGDLPPGERRRRGRALPLLRRLGHEDRGRHQPALVPRHVQLHPARAGRASAG